MSHNPTVVGHDPAAMSQDPATGSIAIRWDQGTAYDLFASLYVLHKPDKFGVRGSWAAGVRSRLPAAERKIFEEIYGNFFVPLHWLHTLPEPKDSATALWMLGKLRPEERLPNLIFSPEHAGSKFLETLQDVLQRRSWDEGDRAVIQEFLHHMKEPVKPQAIETILEWFARPEEFGERYLQALQTYQAVFFAEEERRIRPALQDALAKAQELAQTLSIPDLLAELSQGVRFASLVDVKELVLVPCYWTTPLILFEHMRPDQLLVLFGARPAETALIPGETIPDSLLRALKAMADPTRLRIMRYLANESLTPSELSRRLRLRAPTVIHHLSALRLAGLVELTVENEGEKRYTIRPEAVGANFSILKKFLDVGEDD